MSSSSEKLISEPVVPAAGSFNAEAMARGEPGVPMVFTWRGRTFRVTQVLESKKNYRSCRNGSGEKYVNKHYYSVETDSGETITLYRSRTGSKKDEWIMYTLQEKTPDLQPLKIAVLVSGGGTNLQALIDAQNVADNSASGPVSSTAGRFEIVLVIADRECFATERAKKAGIPAELAVAPKGLPRVDARRAVSDRVLELAKQYEAEALVLAGFLTIMSGPVIEQFSNRIVNLHPALLPKFGGPGMWGHHVHEAVLAAGESESGCTVHLVDSGCDTGPILLQRKVPVLTGDTAETLAARIAGEEHKAIVEGVRVLAEQLRDAQLRDANSQ